MNYRVVITANAKSNLREYCKRAAEHAPETAANWLNRFHAALQTLSSQPDRWSTRGGEFARRAGNPAIQLWQASRNLPSPFTIANDEVQILHIRRAAMGTASPDDLTSWHADPPLLRRRFAVSSSL